MKKMIAAAVVIIFFSLPYPVRAQWIWQNPLPQGNDLHDVYVFDDNSAIAIGNGGTIVRTTDGGANWKIQLIDIDIMSASFVNHKTGWAIGYDSETNKYVVLKTDDRALTWSEVYNSNMPFYNVFFLDMFTGWIAGSSENGWAIMKTTDGGAHWNVQTTGLFIEGPKRLFFVDSDTGWLLCDKMARTGTILLKTTNGGVDWETSYETSACGLSSVFFSNDSIGWIAGGVYDCGDRFGTPAGIILATTNGGKQWFVQSDGIGDGFSSIYFQDSNNGWAVGNVNYGLNEKVLILKTTDGGVNWIVSSNSIKGVPYSIDFSENGTGWTVGADGLIIKSSGDDWVLQSACQIYDNLNSVQFIDEMNGWLLVTSSSSRLYKSVDGGDNWTLEFSGMGYYLKSFCIINKDVGWAAGTKLKGMSDIAVLLNTTDGGQTWAEKNFIPGLELAYVYFGNETTGWIVGQNFATDEDMILKTNDGGVNWDTSYIYNGAYSIDAFFSDNNTGWVGINASGAGVLIKTTDGGLNWTSYSSPYSSSIYFLNNSTGWMIEANNILKTTDGGSSWITQFNEDYHLLNSIYFIDQNIGWAVGYSFNYYTWSTRGLILKTTDGGEDWIPQPTGVVSNLNSVCFVNENTGWAVGDNGTIMKTVNGGITIISEKDLYTTPNDFLLSQNYPNPFNPATTINYQLPQPGFATLKIYDVLGKEVATLVNEEQASGRYSVNFNAGGLASGVYIYRLTAGKYSASRKLILLK
jgi:photosystem II stability/assembly factor-like uncharacterized protein